MHGHNRFSKGLNFELVLISVNSAKIPISELTLKEKNCFPFLANIAFPYGVCRVVTLAGLDMTLLEMVEHQSTST